jgi:hypothetical protein
MVAIIKTGHSLHNIFNYNENKVKQEVALCIGEGNYPIDADKMSLTMKLNRLLKQTALNDNVKRNSVHISLNFDPSENHSKEKLMDIANTYMDKIGFGGQPYLVYEHYDSGHPHLHIVSIKIRADGSRIDMQNIGRNQSETARKQIEDSFGLVKAQGYKNNEVTRLQPIVSAKIKYGQSESKRAINNVLAEVLSTYKYSSLAQLNAILQQYRVLADRGNENSKLFKTKGLVYRILDEKGNPIGVPIKASLFYNKPTLKFLEEKFAANTTVKTSDRNRIKNAIDKALLRTKMSMTELITLLEKEGINTVFRKNTEGLLYGITYVDHTTKCVFNGSTLGKEYSAKAIQERCTPTLKEEPIQISSPEKTDQTRSQTTNPVSAKVPFSGAAENSKTVPSNTSTGQLLEQLTQFEQNPNYIPNQLKGKRKKKKRKGQSDNQ